ncbi:MAG: hypothetical protein Q4E34_00305 [Synergistaceae bacterium]|nr:hypothetical protein [Synergistaceae bacterium]
MEKRYWIEQRLLLIQALMEAFEKCYSDFGLEEDPKEYAEKAWLIFNHTKDLMDELIDYIR